MNKELKYIKHTYNSAIAIGWLGLVGGVIMFIVVVMMGKSLIPIFVPIVGLVGGILLLVYGKKLKKEQSDLILVKKRLISIIIISVIFLLLSGGILILLVLIYAIIGLNQVKKIQKKDIEKIDLEK